MKIKEIDKDGVTTLEDGVELAGVMNPEDTLNEYRMRRYLFTNFYDRLLGYKEHPGDLIKKEKL